MLCVCVCVCVCTRVYADLFSFDHVGWMEYQFISLCNSINYEDGLMPYLRRVLCVIQHSCLRLGSRVWAGSDGVVWAGTRTECPCPLSLCLSPKYFIHTHIYMHTHTHTHTHSHTHTHTQGGSKNRNQSTGADQRHRAGWTRVSGMDSPSTHKLLFIVSTAAPGVWLSAVLISVFSIESPHLI